MVTNKDLQKARYVIQSFSFHAKFQIFANKINPNWAKTNFQITCISFFALLFNGVHDQNRNTLEGGLITIVWIFENSSSAFLLYQAITYFSIAKRHWNQLFHCFKSITTMILAINYPNDSTYEFRNKKLNTDFSLKKKYPT